MKSLKQIQNEIEDLRIMENVMISMQDEGEKVIENIGDYDKYKSASNKKINKLKSRAKLKEICLHAFKFSKKAVACFGVLVIFATAMIVPNQTVMAQIAEYLATRYETHFEIQTGTNGEDINFMHNAENCFGYLPEGYEISEIDLTKSSIQATSVKLVNDEISMLEINITNDLNFYVDAENGTVIEEGYFEGSPYTYMLNEENNSQIYIIKTDDTIIYCKHMNLAQYSSINILEFEKIVQNIKIN
ncbi:MAG: hypothetical protein R3Y32_07015 [Bacillota bacterium]